MNSGLDSQSIPDQKCERTEGKEDNINKKCEGCMKNLSVANIEKGQDKGTNKKKVQKIKRGQRQSDRK